MRFSLLFSLSGFALSSLMAFVLDSQFGAGVGFAAGFAWLGMWLNGY